MTGIQLQQVREETKCFLALHWPTELWTSPPEWNVPWYLQGTMPGGDKQGVYALLGDAENVIYIGVGASFGGGNYEGHGIGARTSRYFEMARDQRGVPVKERRYAPSRAWESRGLQSIATLGFEPNQAYLAYGLEAYLLSKLVPQFNKVRSARLTN